MSKIYSPSILLPLFAMIWGAPAWAEPAATGTPESADPDTRVWQLTDYLKGTAPQIRDQVNGELERLTAKQKDLRQRCSKYAPAILAEQAAATAAARKSDVYQKILVEKNEAESDLKTARESGTPQEKLDASSKFNHLREALEKMESDAVANDAKIPQLLKDKLEDDKGLKRCDDAVATAKKWRDTLVSAVRTAFTLVWPLDVGATGILGSVTPLEDPDHGSITVKFEAFEMLRDNGEKEGIRQLSGFPHKVRLHVTGIDTRGMSKDTPVELDRNFVVTRVPRPGDDEPVYEVQPKKDPRDRLFELLIPLREMPPEKR